MESVYLSIGSNTGDRVFYMAESLKAIEGKIGPIVKKSAIYETQAWGFSGQDFLNMAVVVETSSDPLKILHTIKEIEMELGRERKSEGYTNRTIDVDILFFGNRVLSGEGLVVPHPQIQKRSFVLVPLNEIAPEYVHPVLQKPVKQLLGECADTGWIREADFR